GGEQEQKREELHRAVTGASAESPAAAVVVNGRLTSRGTGFRGEAVMSTSNGRARLLPARSSRIDSTSTRYDPCRHAFVGVKRHVRSLSAVATEPATGAPASSITRRQRRSSA